MGNVAEIDFKAKAEESRIRALLEDLVVESYQDRLALAVWYAKSQERQDQYLFLLFGGPPFEGIAQTTVPLYWKSGSPGPPQVHIDAAHVRWFSKLLKADPQRLVRYQSDYEVLRSDKGLLSQEVLDRFRIVTEPPGLIKGWYVSESEYARRSAAVGSLLSLYTGTPTFGLIKTAESTDFENCRGILHVEIGQEWVPFTPEGIKSYSYYIDFQNGRPIYFLFEGGSLYQVLKFEVRTAPEYLSQFHLLRSTPNDRYPEVYLRSVHPTAKPTA